MARKDLRVLTDQVGLFVLKSQRADYVSVRQNYPKLTRPIFRQIMRALARKKVVKQDKRRYWHVIMNTDGAPKPKKEAPVKTRKPRAKKKASTHPEKPAPKKVSRKAKDEFLSQLSGILGERGKKIIREIYEDVDLAEKLRKIRKEFP